MIKQYVIWLGKRKNFVTQTEKTAIKSAEERLENERKEKLQQEIYDYLKHELDSIDEIDERLSKLKAEKIAHEENIKNIKQGNLEAIEKRRQSFPYTFTTTVSTPLWYSTTASGISTSNSTVLPSLFTNTLAGMTIKSSGGRITIF